MSDRNQHETWNPFCAPLTKLSEKELADVERAKAWSWYLNGGGGDPSYFDYATYIRNVERREEDRNQTI